MAASNNPQQLTGAVAKTYTAADFLKDFDLEQQEKSMQPPQGPLVPPSGLNVSWNKEPEFSGYQGPLGALNYGLDSVMAPVRGVTDQAINAYTFNLQPRDMTRQPGFNELPGWAQESYKNPVSNIVGSGLGSLMGGGTIYKALPQNIPSLLKGPATAGFYSGAAGLPPLLRGETDLVNYATQIPFDAASGFFGGKGIGGAALEGTGEGLAGAGSSIASDVFHHRPVDWKKASRDFGTQFAVGAGLSYGMSKAQNQQAQENQTEQSYGDNVRELKAKVVFSPEEMSDIEKARLRNDFQREQLRQAYGVTHTRDLKNPERIEQRKAIANELYGQGAPNKNKRVDIVIGPPGAGKSTAVVDPLAKKHGAIVVDSDLVKEKLPEYGKGEGADLVHEESSHVVNTLILPQAVIKGDNIVFPIVGKTENNLRGWIQYFKQNGYEVNLHNVKVNPDESARRVYDRYKKTGRFVDPDYASSVGFKPSENFAKIIAEGKDINEYTETSTSKTAQKARPERYSQVQPQLGELQRRQPTGGRRGDRKAQGRTGRINPATAKTLPPGAQPGFMRMPGPGDDLPDWIPESVKKSVYEQEAPIQEPSEGDKPTRFANKTVRESMNTAPEVIKGSTSYRQGAGVGEDSMGVTTTDEARKAEARKQIDADFEGTLDRILEELHTKTKFVKDSQTVVTAEMLAYELAKKGRHNQAIDIHERLGEKLFYAGQTIQAGSIWNKLSPEGALKYATRTVKKANTGKKGQVEKAKKLQKKAKDVTDAGKPNEGDVDKALENVLGKGGQPRKFKLRNQVVDEGKAYQQQLKQQQAQLERELKDEQAKGQAADQEKVKQLKLQLQKTLNELKLRPKVVDEQKAYQQQLKEQQAQLEKELLEEQSKGQKSNPERVKQLKLQLQEKQKLLKLKNPVVDEGKAYAQQLKEQRRKLEIAIRKEQAKQARANSPRVQQLKLKLKKVIAAEEQLKNKIVGHVKPYIPKKKDPQAVMVDTLFKVAKETLPERGKPVPPNPMALLQDALKNKDKYTEVYAKAKKLVTEEFKDDPAALQAIDAYVKATFGRPYDKKLVEKTVRQYIKSSGFDVKTVVKQHYLKQNASVAELESNLINQAGLTKQEAKIFMKDLSAEMDRLTGQARRTRLKQVLKDTPPKEQRSLINRLIEMGNLGALHEDSYRQAVAKKMGIAWLDEASAKKIFEKSSELQNAKTKNEKEILAAQLEAMVADHVPIGFWEKTAAFQRMAQLVNTKTTVRNVVGNQSFDVQETATQYLAALLDMPISAVTGKRSIVIPDHKMKARSGVRGLKQELGDIWVHKVNRANSGSKYDLPHNRIFKDGFFGWAEKVLNTELRAVDRAYFMMTYRESLMNQLRAARKSGQPRTRITEEMQNQALHEAWYRTFQDETALAIALSSTKRILNIAGPETPGKIMRIRKGEESKRGLLDNKYGLGNQVINYPKTPANILQRGIDYSPFNLARVVYEGTAPLLSKGNVKFNQREFTMHLARTLVGTGAFPLTATRTGIHLVAEYPTTAMAISGLLGVGYYLAKLGILTGEKKKQRKVAALEQEYGSGAYRINVSALFRFTMSGLNPEAAKAKNGDTIYSYDWLLPSSLSVSPGANLAKPEKEKIGQAEDFVSQWIRASVQASEVLTEQSVTQGVQRLFNTRNDEGDPSIAEGIVETATGAPASFVPSTLNAITQKFDNTVRDTRDPNLLKQMANQVAAKIPGLSQTLPEMRTIYGEPRQRYQNNSNTWFNVFLNPGKVSELNLDPVSKQIKAIYNTTGETSHIPRIAPRTVQLTLNGKPQSMVLNARQHSDYQKYIGVKTKQAFTILQQIPQFQSLSAQAKSKVMANVISDIDQAAKYELFKDRPNAKLSMLAIGIINKDKNFQNVALAQYMGQAGINEIIQPARNAVNQQYNKVLTTPKK